MPGPCPPVLAEALRASGQAGRDLMDIDWAAHPLGPPDRWPRALANAVRIMLSSRFSMWMAWGPQLTFFCNDAYRRDTLGSKYPWALGRPASWVWQEIWADIGPRIGRVISTGRATWDQSLMLFLKRSGYVEETYHTFSYSPLTDDDGAIAGVLCVVSEETDRVIGERRMRTLQDLGTDATLVREEADVFAAARVHLAANARCLPFTLAYLSDGSGTARLVCATGIEAGHPAAPDTIGTADRDPVWPVGEVATGLEPLVLLDDRFPDLPAGAWPDPPRQAAVLPLQTPGGETISGALVVGLNRYRPYDDDYRGFLRLIAGQLGTGVAAARAYQAERRRAEALTELDQAKTAFFTNVSHEFRTPLTLFLGPAEDALNDTRQPLRGVQRERVELMHRNALRMLKLVNMLLDFSRLQSGRMSARYEPVDLGRYTAELVSMFRPAFARAGLGLRVERGDGDLTGHIDREMWAKIVLNLLSNALKHTFTGGVVVRVDGGRECLELSVADTGTGIEPAEQAHLFERFHRVGGARARSYEGSGIGLALVAELAALHGGRASVTSALDQGSTFTVTVSRGRAHLPDGHLPDGHLPDGHLPDGQVLADPMAGPRSGAVPEQHDLPNRVAEGFLTEAMRWSADPPSTAASAPTGSALPHLPADAPRVLVVDDNADMRNYLRSLLSESYLVDTAPDGVAALERIRGGRPDLVLSDVMMPGMDGFGLLQKLRGDPGTADIPVILVSARAGDDATVEGLDAGADDYLVKPFSARELRARVRSNLELDRSRRTAVELERSRSLLDQAQRLAAVGSWEVDLSTGAICASQEFARQTGYDVEELHALGARRVLRRIVHPDDAGRMWSALRRAVTGRPLDVEIRIVRRDGAVRPHRVLGERIDDVAGRPARLRGSSQDVTEQVRARELQAAAAAAREAAAREHEIAEQLQLSLLPERQFAPAHLRIATYYRPGVEGAHIGGDWYDVLDLGADRAGLVIGDVMGRGVVAATVMAQLRASVRAFARLDLPPAEVLELLDEVVRDLGDDQIVTCLYAVHDPGERILTYANAGHLPPLLTTADRGVLRLTAAAGPPLGSGPLTLGQETVPLRAGTGLALYTDGLVERRDIDIDQGIDALAAALASDVAREDPAALVAHLLPNGPDDDVAVLLAEVTSRPVASTSLTWPIDAGPAGVHRARRLADAALVPWALPSGLHADVVLVVSELLTNAILHGGSPVELRLRRDRSALIVEVHDATPVMPRLLRPAAADDVHGRGLHLVSQIARRWGVRPTPGGKAVWCAFTLP